MGGANNRISKSGAVDVGGISGFACAPPRRRDRRNGTAGQIGRADICTRAVRSGRRMETGSYFTQQGKTYDLFTRGIASDVKPDLIVKKRLQEVPQRLVVAMA